MFKTQCSTHAAYILVEMALTVLMTVRTTRVRVFPAILAATVWMVREW